MSHSRQTEHYGLPLYDGTDIINPLTDFNNANEAIDEAVYNANQRSVQAEQTADEAKGIAEGYDARVTQAINTANGAMTLANNTQDMIADDFDPMKEGGYKVGDFVIYNGVLYRFINAHTGAWDASDVQVSPVLIEAIGEVVDEGKEAINEAVAEAEEEIAGQTEKVTKTQAMIAQPFDANKVGGYAVDDVVTYADKLYKFTSAHSGAWTGLDVEQVDVIGLMPNVIRIGLDNTTTYKTLISNIITSLNSLGISSLYGIKECSLIIQTSETGKNIYRMCKMSSNDGILLTLTDNLVSANMCSMDIKNILMHTTTSRIAAQSVTLRFTTSGFSNYNYYDQTDETISAQYAGAFAEFVWR